MANDPPTSMHMRFGGLEAQEIGVTRFHQPRAASSINAEIDERRAWRHIKWLSERHPDLKEKFAEIARKNAHERHPYRRTAIQMLEPIRDKRRLERYLKKYPPQSN
jgi:hypothetical protein